MTSTQTIAAEAPGGVVTDPDARTPGEPLIKVSGLSKSYTVKKRGQKAGVSTILDGLDFEIEQGECSSSR